MKSRLKRSLQIKKYPSRSKVYIRRKEGRLQIDGLGVWHSYWRDPYHLLLTVSWPGFIVLTTVVYLAINTFFALLYMLGSDNIANARPGSFLDHFFFSVQTLASIGYGAMYPQTIYANSIVAIEAMFGLVGIAVMTGLAFARFSRPTAKVIFSKHAVIAPHGGIPALMFRTANQRRNQILEAQLNVYLMRDEITEAGDYMRRIYDLPLLRNRTPSFSLSWTVFHLIDETSPLYGMSLDAIAQANTTLVVSLSGTDDTVAQTIHARHTYAHQDLKWDHQLVDIFHHTETGDNYLDYTHFHDIKPLERGEF
jgi:inward rectifier potassium channel